MKKAQIILLNGVGSSGKTSLARALQTTLEDAFLHVEMDTFLEMLPARYLNDTDGFTFASSIQDGKDVVSIRSGPVARRAMHGMRHAVVALARVCLHTERTCVATRTAAREARDAANTGRIAKERN
ncbi:phosphotransferase-like protein, partial [Burkholderia ubonensis]|uniref:phosphotransferase-like protein n=1 Tax=Burkholderia ubonensis TaxID=101571 RepID=UPI000AEFE2D4